MDIGYDFFLFIAFFVPGVFITYALSLIITPLKTLLGIGVDSKDGNSWIFIFSLCILLGMMSSILRSVFIDSTFKIDFSSSGIFQGKDNWKSMSSIEPDYSKLTKDELDNLKELKNEEKRPYQFYGNMIVAFTCLLICLLILCIKKNTKKAWSQFVLIMITYLFISWVLYIGCRYSHYYYTIGIKELNN